MRCGSEVSPPPSMSHISSFAFAALRFNFFSFWYRAFAPSLRAVGRNAAAILRLRAPEFRILIALRTCAPRTGVSLRGRITVAAAHAHHAACATRMGRVAEPHIARQQVHCGRTLALPGVTTSKGEGNAVTYVGLVAHGPQACADAANARWNVVARSGAAQVQNQVRWRPVLARAERLLEGAAVSRAYLVRRQILAIWR